MGQSPPAAGPGGGSFCTELDPGCAADVPGSRITETTESESESNSDHGSEARGGRVETSSQSRNRECSDRVMSLYIVKG